jgi:hypothetical protein
MLNFKYLVLSLALSLVKSKPAGDRVISLPDINGGKPLSYEMYSGYLSVNGT